MTITSTLFGRILITLAALTLLACQRPGADRVPVREYLPPSGIALMPLWLGAPNPEISRQKKSVLDCTLAELCYLEGEPLENAAGIVSEIVQEELENKFQKEIFPLDQARYAYTLTDKEESDTLQSIAVRFGRKLEVKYVLGGTLWRFEERIGSALGAESPASVGFALFLIRVEDGAILWQGTFDRTQTALTENLFDARLFFRTGMKWLTAGELAEYGADRLLDDLPLK